MNWPRPEKAPPPSRKYVQLISARADAIDKFDACSQRRQRRRGLSAPLVSVHNVQKTYFTRQTSVQAVVSASLDVARGESSSRCSVPAVAARASLLMMIAGPRNSRPADRSCSAGRK